MSESGRKDARKTQEFEVNFVISGTLFVAIPFALFGKLPVRRF